ncbi:MAG: pyrroline-5-carboxylate reductase [Nitrospinales bacterium]
MLKSKKLGFLGAGNMTEAIIKGLLSASFIAAKNILASDILAARLDYLHKEYKIKTTGSNSEVVEKSDIILLAVKPQAIDKLLNEIKPLDTDQKLFVSIIAGVPTDIIEGILNDSEARKTAVVRTMPNTPALVQEAATAISPGANVSKNDIRLVHRIFEAIGKTVDVDEEQLDAVTGLSGSGPAYLFMIIEALSDAGVKMGLSRNTSNLLTVQTILGAAKLALESGKHPGELKDMVTSPGGTTISGLHTLEAGGLRTSLMDAVEIATKRSAQLGKNIRDGARKGKK